MGMAPSFSACLILLIVAAYRISWSSVMTDVEVHPNVDKRSFIRAKQNQIHMERQQRKIQTEALKYEQVVNDGLTTTFLACIDLESYKGS